jgi:UDP-glucose:(glucosyl)LPS alpha-1,2-glucosyltransferase
MTDNYDLIENNEVGAKAMGGTEMYMRFIYDGTVDRKLLENVQIIPSRFRKLEPEKIRIWFEHNLPNDPESIKLKDPEFRAQFHSIVFLSNWHYQIFQTVLGVPYSTQCSVIEGGFGPVEVDFAKKPDPDKGVQIAYFTTPHRGLEILVPVFQKLAETDKNIHLHVHSSFQMYGWDDRDKQYEPLYKICREHPQITYHGFTEYYKLKSMLPDYHIFAYPNIWPETMCRSVLEAMSAGMICVHPNLAAIPDTTGCLNFMYDGTNDMNEHANLFASNLMAAVNVIRTKNDGIRNRLMFNKSYIDTRFDPVLCHNRWSSLLNNLNRKYPTVESRAVVVPKEEFVYKA